MISELKKIIIIILMASICGVVSHKNEIKAVYAKNLKADYCPSKNIKYIVNKFGDKKNENKQSN